MPRLAAALSIVLGTVAPAAAQPLICFGNEPSWSIDLTQIDRARVTSPGSQPVDYAGQLTVNTVLRERLWRGRADGGAGDLVVLLRDQACSDGMSDTTHPVSVRASTPDGAFLVGCCRVPASPAGAIGGQSAVLEQTTWQLLTLPGQPPARLAALPRALTIRLESGRVSGFSGCNMFSGQYTLEKNRITFGALAGTMMACADTGRNELERAFKAALTDAVTYVIEGNRLTLTTRLGAMLTFEREPRVALEGAMWTVTGYNNGRQAVVSPIANSQLTITFQSGTVSGQAGCNTFTAPYTADASNLSFGPAATTRRACADNLMTQERAFLAAIESTSRWVIEGGLLHLHRADGGRVLTASRR
jgi:heat shock protein HslJ